MRFLEANLPRSRWAGGRRARHALALMPVLMAGYLFAASCGNRVAAEPAYLAGGVTSIPYNDPMGPPAPRRDLYAADDGITDSDPLLYALSILAIAGLSFWLGYLWRGSAPKKPTKHDAIGAITKTFNATRDEAKIWNRPEDAHDIGKVLDKAENGVKAAVGALFPSDKK